MFAKIFVFYLPVMILTPTLARPGHSTHGTNFVIPYPYYPLNTTVWIHLNTLEEQVNTDIILPNMVCRYVIKKHEQFNYVLPRSLGFNGNAIFPAVHLNSSGPMRVFVNTQAEPYHVADTFRVIPKDSCYQSYYVSTTTDYIYTFINVLAFNYPLTRVKITFPPRHHTTFNVNCSADVNCEPGKTININLSRYHAWQFGGDDIELQNTLITSDNPVFVISGSMQFHPPSLSISSMKPTQSWGKTYVIPHNALQKKMFLFNTRDFPLVVTVYDGDKPKQNSVIENDKAILDLGQTSGMLIFTSNVPFALYQVFPGVNIDKALVSVSLNPPPLVNDSKISTIFTNGSARHKKGSRNSKTIRRIFAERHVDASILNLIPAEQWMHGNFFIPPHIESTARFTYTMTFQTISHKHVIFSDVERTPDWSLKKSITVNKIAYGSGEVNLLGVNHTRIYTSNPSGRMMLYVHGNLGETLSNSFSFPYDFYQTKIYDPSCKAATDFGPNDGMDNDCDGFVDEEYENGRDDDGDGKIDEDFVEQNQDGEWSEWQPVCKLNCLNKSLDVTGRSCLKQSGFGSFCQGDDIRCDGKACPSYCSHGPRRYTDCYCGMCDRCKYGFFKCDRCKPGFMSTLHCTTPCTRGWTGLGCKESQPVQRIFTKKDSLSWFLIVTTCITVSTVALIGSCVLLFLKMKRDGKRAEHGEMRVKSISFISKSSSSRNYEEMLEESTTERSTTEIIYPLTFHGRSTLFYNNPTQSLSSRSKDDRKSLQGDEGNENDIQEVET